MTYNKLITCNAAPFNSKMHWYDLLAPAFPAEATTLIWMIRLSTTTGPYRLLSPGFGSLRPLLTQTLHDVLDRTSSIKRRVARCETCASTVQLHQSPHTIDINWFCSSLDGTQTHTITQSWITVLRRLWKISTISESPLVQLDAFEPKPGCPSHHRRGLRIEVSDEGTKLTKYRSAPQRCFSSMLSPWSIMIFGKHHLGWLWMTVSHLESNSGFFVFANKTDSGRGLFFCKRVGMTFTLVVCDMSVWVL